MKLFLLALSLLFLSLPVYAKINYDIVIPVDIDAEDSVIAKEKAMIQAQRQAFLEAAGKLTSQTNVDKLNELSDDEIMHFVQSVSVADEKAGGTKYIANLTVQINENLLKDYLAENEMIKTKTEDMIVVPVFKNQSYNYPLFWEEDNIWRKIWLSKGLIKFGNMQMRTLNDRFRYEIDANANDFLYMDDNLYDKISQATGSEKIYVIYGEILENNDLKVTIKNEKTRAEDRFAVYNDGSSDILDKAIEKSVMFISNMERENKSTDNQIDRGSVNAVYMYQDMKDWLLKSKTLSEIDQIEGIDTNGFGGGKVNFVIHYSGNLDDLWDALQEQGFSHESAGNYFIIR